jgi:AraC-like DNA-binding protein
MSAPKTRPLNAASARWQARRRRLMAYGQWEPFVDAAPVRAHLRAINASGMPISAVCERLGLPHTSSLQHLLYGRGEYGPGQQVRRETAQLVLSYWPCLADFPDHARIDSTGTRRRVQALMVRGWPRHLMATEIGMSATYFKKALHKDRVTAHMAREVAALYDTWWDQDPMEHGLAQRVVNRVRADAARDGLCGPLAWDEDTIDDPKALPVTDAMEPVATEGGNVAARWLMGESVILGRDDRREVLAHLYEWTNDTTAEIAARLEMTPAAAERQWERMKERAAADGRRLWRRVYVPRERDLKQDELEEAA